MKTMVNEKMQIVFEGYGNRLDDCRMDGSQLSELQSLLLLGTNAALTMLAEFGDKDKQELVHSFINALSLMNDPDPKIKRKGK